MRALRAFWFPIFLAVGFFTWCLISLRGNRSAPAVKAFHPPYREGDDWIPPSEAEIPFTKEGELIRYGKELIAHTAQYLGPKGKIRALTNNMNCQNCHIYAGTQSFGNPFSAVAATYPQYRNRSGRVETVEFRINDCMKRSLNGGELEENSREMKAMVAYIKWVGSNVPKSLRPKGAGTEALPFLNRPADPAKGKSIFQKSCVRCHGENGQGLLMPDSTGYVYPPLWGEESYNIGAGLYRLGFLAGFIKNNMPFGVNRYTPELSSEQAWDVAAYIASQPRPVKYFEGDWKDLSKKPYDFPFGPYADSFPEKQHKYGPFGPIQQKRKKSS